MPRAQHFTLVVKLSLFSSLKVVRLYFSKLYVSAEVTGNQSCIHIFLIFGILLIPDTSANL